MGSVWDLSNLHSFRYVTLSPSWATGSIFSWCLLEAQRTLTHMVQRERVSQKSEPGNHHSVATLGRDSESLPRKQGQEETTMGLPSAARHRTSGLGNLLLGGTADRFPHRYHTVQKARPKGDPHPLSSWTHSRSETKMVCAQQMLVHCMIQDTLLLLNSLMFHSHGPDNRWT